MDLTLWSRRLRGSYCRLGAICVLASTVLAKPPVQRADQILQRSEILIKEAYQEFERGEFLKAAQNFRTVTRLLPEHETAFLGLGLSLAAAKKFREAGEALMTADKLTPNRFDVVFARAQVASALGKLDAASEHLVRAKRLQTDTPRVGLLDVEIDLGRKQVPQALAKAKRLSSRFSAHGQVRGALGLILLRGGAVREASEELEAAYNLAPRNLTFAVALAEARIALGNPAAAMALIRALRSASDRLSEIGEEWRVHLHRLAAQAQKRTGEYRGAIEDANMLLELEPGNPENWLLLGSIHLQQGEDSEAAAALEQALKLAPDSAELHGSVVRLYHRHQQYVAGRNFLEGIIAASPNPRFWVDLVELELLAEDDERVRTNLRRAAKAFPGHGRLHAQLGHLLHVRGKPDLALAEFLRAQQTGLRDAEASLTLARLQGARGAFPDSIESALPVEEEPALPPQIRAAAAAIIGSAYMGAGNEEEAIRHLQMAVEFAPDFEGNYRSLAQVYGTIERYKDSVAVLMRARTRGFGSPGLLSSLGSYHLRAGDHRAAIEVLAEVASLFPEQIDAYMPLARAYQLDGQPALAVETLRSLERRESGYPMLHVMLARALLEDGSQREALEALKRAEEASGSDDPDVYTLRAQIHTSLGQFQEAVQALNRALRIRPDLPGLFYQLGLAHRRLGNEALAREYMAKNAHFEPESEWEAWQVLEEAGSVENKIRMGQDFLQRYPESELTNRVRKVLALAYRESDNYERFVSYAEASLREDPDDPELLAALAIVFVERGVIEHAIDRAKRVLVGEGKETANQLPEWRTERDANYALGFAYLRKAESSQEDRDALLENSVKHLLEAIRIDPGFGMAHFRLGHAYSKMNDVEKGAAYLARAVAAGDVEDARSALEDLYPLIHGNTEGLEEFVEQQRDYLSRDEVMP